MFIETTQQIGKSGKRRVIQKRHALLLILPLILPLISSGCLFLFNRELKEEKSLSHLTLDGDYIYFGGGHKLYRLNITSRDIETIYATDRILVEQPIIADGIAYFGGRMAADKDGRYGEQQGFFAVDIQSKKLQWKFPLGVGGYGTYGTYPALANDRILVCAREHLHCLERKSGKEIWRVDNWMGKVSDSVTLPYMYGNYAYFKIAEEHVANSKKNDENDGHWAEVSLDTGQRSVIHVAKHPGTWEHSSGEGLGALVDGVIYGKTRINTFGAFDLKAKKMLWEIEGYNYPQPAVNDKYVFTVIGDRISALKRQTGEVAWQTNLNEIADTGIDESKDRIKSDYEKYWSRRFAVSSEVVIAQGSKGILALNVKNGERLWLTKTESIRSDANPLIVGQTVIAISDKDCSIFAIDIKTGKESWRVQVPDCTSYYWIDD